MVTQQDVINAYRFFLGREPENDKVIEEKITTCGDDFEKLRQEFLSSDEFRKLHRIEHKEPAQKFDFDSIRMKIEVCDAKQRKELLRHTQRTWKKMGEADPYWSVLTAPKYHMNRITDERKKEFYDSGRNAAKTVIATAIRNGIVDCEEQLKEKNVLELGCGVGRVTQGLAKYFHEVTAVDISKGNMDIARKVCPENVEFILVSEIEQYEKLPKADVVYSRLVLQHNCPPRDGLFAGESFFCIERRRHGISANADISKRIHILL